MNQPTNQLEITDQDIALAVPATPVELLRIAVTQGADIEKLSKLMDLQLRWEQNEARKAFVKAMTAFKSNPPTIDKNQHVKFKDTEYDHATLDHVCDAITAALSKHDISHRWQVKQDNGLIAVTCVLTHASGHSEETELKAPPDTSGSKNAVQAIASTVTYLERYTLLAATGLAAKNTDNDGSGGVSMGDLAERLEWLENASDEGELRKLFTEAYREGKAVNDQNALKALIAAKDKRLKELR